MLAEVRSRLQLWPVCLSQGVPHGLDLLKVARHVRGHDHLDDQRPQLPAEWPRHRINIISEQPHRFQTCVCVCMCVCTSSPPCSGLPGCSCPPRPSACRRHSRDDSPALTGRCTEWPPPTWHTDNLKMRLQCGHDYLDNSRVLGKVLVPVFITLCECGSCWSFLYVQSRESLPQTP